MYEHLVIADLQRFIKTRRYNPPGQKDWFTWIKRTDGLINEAQRFHLPPASKTYEMIKKRIGEPMFRHASEYLRLPFRKCWFDWQADIPLINPVNINAKRRALYIEELRPGLWNLLVYYHNPEVNEWVLRRVRYLIFIGEAHITVKDEDVLGAEVAEVLARYLKGSSGRNIYPIPLCTDIPVSSIGGMVEEDQEDLEHLEVCILLLNCKNVRTETVHAPQRLNKQRKKRGKLPILSYHTLKIDVPKEVGRNNAGQEFSLYQNRIHFCRGHIKHYSKAAPLFGRHVGLWYWAPHVRGRNRDGVVQKDYRVEVNEST